MYNESCNDRGGIPRVNGQTIVLQFLSELTGLIAFLLRQQNLQTEMRATCPNFASTRCLSIKRITTWLKTHHVRVTEYVNTKKPACTLTVDQWIVLLCLDYVATVLSSTVTRLQGLSTLLSEQKAELEKLCASLSKMRKIEGPLSVTQLEAVDSATTLTRGEFSVTIVGATTFIRDHGAFVIDSLKTIPRERSAAITRSVVNLFAGFYTGIMNVVASRDSKNRSLTDALPPVLLHNLATIRTNELCKIICFHPTRLEQPGWTPEQIDQIEEDHRELQRAVSSESQLKALLRECFESSKSFIESWVLCRTRFDNLQLFAGSLASMFPNIASVESELSLEGIIHAKQFESFCSLFTA